jgi:predicted Rossmann fold nucleotide-binding protein DprA/Smf involved in DNA uptake
MITPLTPNTQAILLLTAPLIVGAGQVSPELLTLSEYNRLTRILREKQKQPADLLGLDAQPLMALCAEVFGQARLESLLGRGFLLSQAVDRWNARGIRVVSRADTDYPARLKERLKEYAPPLLYGCGDMTLLNTGGLAVVGSRHVDVELIEFTENVGRLAAKSHQPLLSGGAKGIDQAAMRGALAADGVAVGIMADSLERAALAHDNRESLMDRKLVLASPYDPCAGFNVGNAMQRNKLIYALADAALVVTADFEKGGTWAGAIEQLDRFHFVPVFVRNSTNAGKGIPALIQRGALPWPNPDDASDLGRALSEAAETVAAVPVQTTMPFILEEKPSVYGAEKITKVPHQSSASNKKPLVTGSYPPAPPKRNKAQR